MPGGRMLLNLKGERVDKLKYFFMVAGVVILSGCASMGTYNAATGRSEFIFVSTPEEITMGQAFHKQLVASEKISQNNEVNERVNRIGQKVALVSDRLDYTYHFYVIEKDELNAFTTPGGNIYIYTGLLNKLSSDDQIAAVLAHEVGHCAARHTVKKYQAALGYGLVTDIIFNRTKMDEQVKQIAALSSGALMALVSSAYSRGDEYEADKLGLKYLDLSQYDLNGMVQSFEVLEKESSRGGMPLILRSHPYIEDRIQAVKTEIQRLHSLGV